VALLDLAAALCARQDVDPRQVIHLPCDELQARDLRRAFTIGHAVTRSVDQPDPRPRAWLLDEISAARGWTSVVKSARDNSMVGNDTMILSGSRWRVDEDVQGNLLAGRAGRGESRRVRHLHPASIQTPAVPKELGRLSFEVDEYDLAWQEFLSCGGFPRAVAEHKATGQVSPGFQRDLLAWLRADTDPGASAESLPILIAMLVARGASSLNIRATAAALGVTRESLTPRLHRLAAGFAALWCPQRDEVGRSVQGAQSKLYLADPLLAWLPVHLRAGLPSPPMTTLTEMTLGVCLARSVDLREEGRWVAGDTIGYIRTRSFGEIDLAPVPVRSPAGPRQTVPIESKWADAGWRAEAKPIENKYAGGILATKSILDLDHPTWAIPSPLVALLLE
jgi:predicted AAA+ superfamily ATPase